MFWLKNFRVQMLVGMVGRRRGTFHSLDEMLALDVMALQKTLKSTS